MGDGDNEEAVGVVRNTGERIVPGQECRKDTESASSLDAAFVGSAAAVLEVANAEEEEGHVKGEEQQEESDG